MEYNKLPKKFTHKYVIDIDSPSYFDTDYDDDIINNSGKLNTEYIKHFFNLNDDLRFSFRYYGGLKRISNIEIMAYSNDDNDDDQCGEQEWLKFYDFKILNDLIKEFDIENSKFNFKFNFSKYVK